MVKASGKECYFMQNNIANLIVRYDAALKFGEYGSQNKLTTTDEGIKIGDRCIKLAIDRLGNIKPA